MVGNAGKVTGGRSARGRGRLHFPCLKFLSTQFDIIDAEHQIGATENWNHSSGDLRVEEFRFCLAEWIHRVKWQVNILMHQIVQEVNHYATLSFVQRIQLIETINHFASLPKRCIYKRINVYMNAKCISKKVITALI